MKKYFLDIYESVSSIVGGMGITLSHLFRARNDNVTLQYPEEKWPRPERNIGFDHSNYNVIRSRLHVDMDDCIGCLKCERACPVDCIKIVTEKAPVRVKILSRSSTKASLPMVLGRLWLLRGLILICLSVATVIYVPIHVQKSVFT